MAEEQDKILEILQNEARKIAETAEWYNLHLETKMATFERVKQRVNFKIQDIINKYGLTQEGKETLLNYTYQANQKVLFFRELNLINLAEIYAVEQFSLGEYTQHFKIS